MSLAAVVLAGGESRRFGGDKLAADLHGLSLLERAVTELPSDARLIIVGPEREIGRPAAFVREEPPGGGPAAAMIAGLRLALSNDSDTIVVLPGDAPAAGRAVRCCGRPRQPSSPPPGTWPGRGSQLDSSSTG
jgi:molybdopterin-guanine dinucleotide biosynthesis protein A